MTEGTAVFTYHGEDPIRLDKFLVDCLPDFSRSQIQRLIKDDNVLVDGKPAGKTGLKVSEIGFGGHSWSYRRVPDGKGEFRKVTVDEFEG